MATGRGAGVPPLSRQIEVEWVEDMNKRGFDGRKLLDTARALIDKHTKA